MSEPTLLVPINYPLEKSPKQTVQAAIDLADRLGDAHLYFLHVNLVHAGKPVKKRRFVDALTNEFGPLEDASYHIREASFLEEAILNEAIQEDVEYVIIGRDRKSRWRQRLADYLNSDVNLETYLATHLDAELVVV